MFTVISLHQKNPHAEISGPEKQQILNISDND